MMPGTVCYFMVEAETGKTITMLEGQQALPRSGDVIRDSRLKEQNIHYVYLVSHVIHPATGGPPEVVVLEKTYGWNMYKKQW